MNTKRRRYDSDNTHSLATWAHDRLDKIDPKLDRISRQQAMIGAGLAVIMFLAANGLLDLGKLVQPAKAEVHAIKP